MVRVYTSDDRILIYHLKNMLEAESIMCMVKNDHAMSLAGEVPAIECWPELWVLDEDMQAKAEKFVLANIVSGKNLEPIWVCTQCGEKHEPQFSECWSCGAEK